MFNTICRHGTTIILGAELCAVCSSGSSGQSRSRRLKCRMNTNIHTWKISLVKPTRFIKVSNLCILEWQSTCFGRSSHPSSGVQDCTYSNRHMSNRYCWLLTECHSRINKFDTLVHLVGFNKEIYYDARASERQIPGKLVVERLPR